jgi:hypothetical protein
MNLEAMIGRRTRKRRRMKIRSNPENSQYLVLRLMVVKRIHHITRSENRMSFFAGHMQPGALAESAKRPKPEAASGSSESESEKEESKSQSSSNEDEPLDFNYIEFLNSCSENAVNVLLKATMSEFS